VLVAGNFCYARDYAIIDNHQDTYVGFLLIQIARACEWDPFIGMDIGKPTNLGCYVWLVTRISVRMIGVTHFT
jgi:hypothetical protein